MKFFADTADIADIRDLAETGLIDGVTTNPSLIHKSGRDFIEVTKEICGVVDGPVSALQVLSPSIVNGTLIQTLSAILRSTSASFIIVS